MKRSLLACRGGLRRCQERPTFKLSRGTSKFVLHRHRACFGGTTIAEVRVTWLLSEEVLESPVQEFIRRFWRHSMLYRHFDDRESWESVQEFTQICMREWRAFPRSAQESVVGGVQNQVKSWTGLSSCRGSARTHDTSPPKDKLQQLCWWTAACSSILSIWSGLFLLYASSSFINFPNLLPRIRSVKYLPFSHGMLVLCYLHMYFTDMRYWLCN